MMRTTKGVMVVALGAVATVGLSACGGGGGAGSGARNAAGQNRFGGGGGGNSSQRPNGRSPQGGAQGGESRGNQGDDPTHAGGRPYNNRGQGRGPRTPQAAPEGYLGKDPAPQDAAQEPAFERPAPKSFPAPVVPDSEATEPRNKTDVRGY